MLSILEISKEELIPSFASSFSLLWMVATRLQTFAFVDANNETVVRRNAPKFRGGTG